MVYGLEVAVLSTGLDVRVQLVEAHELTDHILQESLEPVGAITELLNGVLTVYGIVDPGKLAVELGTCKILRNELRVSLKSRYGIRPQFLHSVVLKGSVQPASKIIRGI